MAHGSLWQQTAKLPDFPPLQGDTHAEVIIIGGGLTGLLTAHLLQESGISALVLEANRIGSGQTGHTTAKITSQHGLLYARLIRQMGSEAAHLYARANEEAIKAFGQIIAERGIECGFAPRAAYLYSRQSPQVLQQEADAARQLGIDATFCRETELPFPVAGAVRFGGQAQFHPLRFLTGIIPGLRICEHTRVMRLEGQQVVTTNGVVTAKHIVFAAHYPFVNVPGCYFMRLHQERSHVLALHSPWLPEEGMYLGVDRDGLSLREAEGLLLLGGGAHRSGENSGGGHYARLQQAASALLPRSREVARWSAQDCMPVSGVPLIGQYAHSRPGWYVATGFGKWGMTGAMVAAQLLTGMICRQPLPWAEVFSPKRLRLKTSARALMNEARHTLRGLTRMVFTQPHMALESLASGHGGVVALDGRKVGAYRSEDGTLHLIDPRCPHLGCQLEWNPDERSWDCPCHGSRFNFDGRLLDGPAQKEISRRPSCRHAEAHRH